MKNRFHFRINIKSRHLLVIMTLFCLACIIGTFASGIGPAPLREAAGVIVVPFQNSIRVIGDYFDKAGDNLRSREELAADIRVGELFDTVEYDYPEFHLSMKCYICELVSEEMELKEHEAARWLGRGELDTVDWLPADKGLIEGLKQLAYMTT